ncbi:helix-turn-helix domain-containing protein [Demequina flava]|uniref:helix-turn-helix domain-containing protein n=1 Tax=Demequina flava TaxID=1095025 RepID=UPI0007845A29|nr:helix-turn-helix transcriptional regulator [Demequina flava]
MRADDAEGARPNSSASPWIELLRDSAKVHLEELPTLTVIATLPTWGASTWMRQCDDFLQKSDGAVTRRLSSRRALWDAASQGKQAAVDVYFVNIPAITDIDDVWDGVSALLALAGRPRVVIRSLDHPPEMGWSSVDVLTEADLSMTEDELHALARVNGVEGPPHIIRGLATDFRGHPGLARRQIELMASSRGQSPWSNPDARLDTHLASILMTRYLGTHAGTPLNSTMLTVLLRASRQRRVTANRLVRAGDKPARVHSCFERMAWLPLGTVDVDTESGETVFEWRPGVWNKYMAERTPEEQSSVLTEALTIARSEGHLSMQVYYLIELKRFSEAEAIVWANLRHFLLAPPDTVQRAITEISWDDVSTHPSLLLVAGEYRSRATADPMPWKHYFSTAQALLNLRKPSDAFEHLQVSARELMATASMGNRKETVRLLATIEELLQDEREPGLLSRASQDPDIARRLAAEMYVPFWAATQVDGQAQALRFTQVMRTHSNPLSLSAEADLSTVVTHEVHMGVSHAEREVLGGGYTDGFIALEHGDDQHALELTRFLEARATQAPSRSAAESFVLAIRALVAPETLDRRTVMGSLERSRNYWDDGRPSKAIVAATAFALLTIGDVAEAMRLVRDYPAEHWFGFLSRALVLLALDRPGEAMDAIELADRRTTSPRPRAISGAIAAAAHVRMGSDVAAIERLEATLRGTTPGLMRVALRFIPAEDFDEIASHQGRASRQLAKVIEASGTDVRHCHRSTAATLTRVDRENLWALHSGMSNKAIAEHRFVSINTVRTQMRMLYKKLGASNRLDAVACAERLGVFETSL